MREYKGITMKWRTERGDEEGVERAKEGVEAVENKLLWSWNIFTGRCSFHCLQ